MNIRKYKLFVRFLSLILAGVLVFNPLMAPLAWATEGDSTIITGDAESDAEVETTANTNIDCLNGEVTTPDGPCESPEIELEGECEETLITNDNTADVTDDADSTAATGENEIAGASGDALIDTGDAEATAEVENEINTNIVVLGEDEDLCGICQSEICEVCETEEECEECEKCETEACKTVEEEENEDEDDNGSVLVVQNENEGSVTNEVDVLAGTGENEANENEGEAAIETGDATALANILNLLNTNIVGSDFEVLLLNCLDGHEGDINLNEIWREVLEGNDSDWVVEEKDGSFFLVRNNNSADLVNNVEVTAVTGENEASANEDQAGINSGDAVALANVVNLVNLNLVGSTFFLGVVNILGEFLGDLILPRPEMFADSDGNGADQVFGIPAEFINQNQAEISDSVMASAETGANETINNQGLSAIQTGDANSQANSFVFANTNINQNDWFFLVVNHLGNWMGNIFGWTAPDSQEAPSEESTEVFQLQPDSENGENGQKQEEQVVLNQNQAKVENNIRVSASTGQNQANENEASAAIETGDATALANLFDLVNLNVFGGRWFFGVVNILGDWTGNLFFAYPDVKVDLTNGTGETSPGETTSYTVSFENQGHDKASNVWVAIELPEGLTYLGDSSGLTAEISGQTCSWFLGNLAMGEGGSFTISVEVGSDPSPVAQVSLWNRLKSKIISPVCAAEEREAVEIVATALIRADEPESDFSNNSATVKTIVYFPEGANGMANETANETNEELNGDQRLPILEIFAWNNVADFVYPGDVVTFEITINNTSDVPSYDTYLYQELFNGLPDEGFGAAGFNIGTIESRKGVVLSFGLKLNGGSVLPVGHYHTEAQAFGFAPNGVEVASNQARTDFNIEWKEMASLFEAKATGREEEVLGSALECSDSEDILPWLLTFFVSGLWLVGKSRGKIKLAKNENNG